MSEIDVRDFFDFGSKLVGSYIMFCPVELKKYVNGVSIYLKLIKGENESISFPVIFKQGQGKKFNDMLDTGWPSLHLISDRMKVILEENELTGWKTYPIKIYDKKGGEIEGYHGFSIIGRSGPTVYDNCEIIERRFIPNGPVAHYYKGVSIDRWDGSDFFIPETTCRICITKKTADILKKNKITNMKLENLADAQIDVNDVIRKKQSSKN